MDTKRKKTTPKAGFPLVRVVCLMVGCVVTLIGAAMGISPEIVLLRTTVAVVAAFVILMITQSLTNAFFE